MLAMQPSSSLDLVCIFHSQVMIHRVFLTSRICLVFCILLSAWSTFDNAPWIKKLEEWIVSVEERHFYTKLIGACLDLQACGIWLTVPLLLDVVYDDAIGFLHEGVCFSHQIIAQALGGVCVRNEAA